MSDVDPVTEKQCDKKLEKVYGRINEMDKSLSKIFGGVAALVFLSTFMVAITAFHINQRFSGVEKTLDKMDTRLVDYISKKTPAK